MLYSLEQGPTEKAIFERSMRYKLPLPEALKNAPSLHMGLEFYYNAFRHLSTCREMGMGIGRITYFMCTKYCRENDIEGDQREDFIVVILAMDETYLEYCDKQSKKKKSNEKPEDETDGKPA